MIYLTSQPDDTFFIWQLLTLGDNMESLGIDKDDIYHLIGFNGTVNSEWDQWKDKVYGNIVFIPDTRVSKQYLVSIRPNIIKQFMKVNPDLINEYVFYHDADILFTDIPLFEGMEDGRVHASDCSGYIGYEYIANKHSPSLIKDLLGCVDIDEETVRMNQMNSGGAQIYARGLGYAYWDKVEQDCERMQAVYFGNINKYKEEYEAGKEKHEPAFNFQNWTFEMWAMLWNMWLFGLKVYANPALKFSWSNHRIEQWNDSAIFHNSGIEDKDPVEGESETEKQYREQQNANWFAKARWKKVFPTDFSAKCEIGIIDGQMIYGCQLNYLKALRKAASKYWLKGFIAEEIEQNEMKSYYFIYLPSDNFDRFINHYNNQTGPKELFILNTTDSIITTTQLDVRMLTSQKSLVTNEYYQSEKEMLEDIHKFVFGRLINIKDGYLY